MTPTEGKTDENIAASEYSCGGIWTPQRRELLTRLQNEANSLSELYEGAVRMMSAGSFPGRVRFVSHAVREIRNRLPDELSGVKSKRLDYSTRVAELVKEWKHLALPLDATIPLSALITEETTPNVRMVPLPESAYSAVAKLVRDHGEASERPLERAFRLFAPESDAQHSALRPAVKQWLTVTKWFDSKAHDSGISSSKYEGEQFQHQFELFESTLMALLRGFFYAIKELDEILDEANARSS